MKRILYIFTTVIGMALTSCNDDCDHNFESNNVDLSQITGSWYNEERNEEIRFSPSGTFYTKYCNIQRAYEFEGMYELDSKNNRLSTTYQFLGRSQYGEWRVLNLSKSELHISSEKDGTHKYFKIIETYNLEVGGTIDITTSTSMLSEETLTYSSSNENLVKVSPQGVITPTGEKGTAYIKVVSELESVVIKVVVGIERYDMWFDYSVLLDCTINQVQNLLGSPDYIDANTNGYAYNTPYHETVNHLYLFIDSESLVVSQIDLHFNESVPSTGIISYLEDHFYSYYKDDLLFHYTTSPKMDVSRAAVLFSKKENIVSLLTGQRYLDNLSNWPDMTNLFGKDKEEIKNAMEALNYVYNFTDFSYSKDGSDYYFGDNKFVDMVGFVFNPDKQMSEYWIYINTDEETKAAVWGFLGWRYKEAKNEDSNGVFVFYNDDKTVKITFHYFDSYVCYTNLTMPNSIAPEDDVSFLWPDVTNRFGMTYEEVIESFNVTPSINDESSIWYGVDNPYIWAIIFKDYYGTGKIDYIAATVKEGIESTIIVEYLNKLYIPYPSGTQSDGSEYAWKNEVGTIGIIYNPTNKLVSYYYLDLR